MMKPRLRVKESDEKNRDAEGLLYFMSTGNTKLPRRLKACKLGYHGFRVKKHLFTFPWGQRLTKN